MKLRSTRSRSITYDPDKAKSYLKKAGMENLKVDFSASDAAFSGGVDAGLLMPGTAPRPLASTST